MTWATSGVRFGRVAFGSSCLPSNQRHNPTILVFRLLNVDQPDVRLMYQSRRLKRLAGGLLRHLLGGQLYDYSGSVTQ